MIPSLVTIAGAPNDVLPPGVHWATLSEIEAVFAQTVHRSWLFEGILSVAAALKAAGCRSMFIGGSFVTSKEKPDDFDGCWDPIKVQHQLLDAVLLDFENGRAAQKWAYRGEMFPSTMKSGPSGTYFDLFQTEIETGAAIGIIGVKLRTDRRLGA